jgi:sugar O-acyltransferase (sialic acid O-acetyltransferase NeuD family)
LGANNPETVRFFKTVSNNYELVGFIDNDQSKWGKDFYGYKVLGGVEEVERLTEKGYFFVNLITRDCVTRHITTNEILDRGGRLCNLIHPTVSLDMVSVGVGNYIQESVILQAETKVGNNASIHIGSLIGHECQIADSVFIAHGCNLSGLVSVAEGVFIGVGATILPRLSIGQWSIVGAGSLVTNNVKPFTVVAGNPARLIRTVDPSNIANLCKPLNIRN